MNMIQRLMHLPTRRVWSCAVFTLVVVATVAVWAGHTSGDRSQTAAMLGATIAVTAAAAGRGSCRPALMQRSRRTSRR